MEYTNNIPSIGCSVNSLVVSLAQIFSLKQLMSIRYAIRLLTIKNFAENQLPKLDISRCAHINTISVDFLEKIGDLWFIFNNMAIRKVINEMG